MNIFFLNADCLSAVIRNCVEFKKLLNSLDGHEYILIKMSPSYIQKRSNQDNEAFSRRRRLIYSSSHSVSNANRSKVK